MVVVLVLSATGSGCGGQSGDSGATSRVSAVTLLPLLPAAAWARVVASLLQASKQPLVRLQAGFQSLHRVGLADKHSLPNRWVWCNCKLSAPGVSREHHSDHAKVCEPDALRDAAEQQPVVADREVLPLSPQVAQHADGLRSSVDVHRDATLTLSQGQPPVTKLEVPGERIAGDPFVVSNRNEPGVILGVDVERQSKPPALIDAELQQGLPVHDQFEPRPNELHGARLDGQRVGGDKELTVGVPSRHVERTPFPLPLLLLIDRPDVRLVVMIWAQNHHVGGDEVLPLGEWHDVVIFEKRVPTGAAPEAALLAKLSRDRTRRVPRHAAQVSPAVVEDGGRFRRVA